jgi:hypothetical protein
MCRRIVMLLPLLLLAACAGGDADVQTTAPAVDPFSWDTDPYSVVFRADISDPGAPESLLRRNEIPECTVYGDGRVVWVNHMGEGQSVILFDQLSEAEVKDFAIELVVTHKIGEFAAAPAGQNEGVIQPVREHVELNLAALNFQSDSFSGWPPGFYDTVADRCRQLSQAPRLFAPVGAWVTVESVSYNPRRPTVYFDADELGLDLAALADTGERIWLEGPVVQQLWQTLHSTSPEVQFSDTVNQYRVAVEAPGVNRLAPPAPAPPPAES